MASFIIIVIGCGCAADVDSFADSADDVEVVAVLSDGSTFPSLYDAVSASTSGMSVKIVSDSTEKRSIDVNGKDIEIDLNGHNVTTTVSSNALRIIGGSTVTLKDSGNSGSFGGKTANVVYIQNGTLDFQGGELYSTAYWTYTNGSQWGETIIAIFGSANSENRDYSNLIVGEDATISFYGDESALAGGGYAILVSHVNNHAYGVNIDMNGKIAGFMAISLYVNGLVKDVSGNIPQIKVGTTADIVGQIYAAGYANWEILGGSVVADNAIEIRAGEMTIQGGNFIGTGSFTTSPNGDGTTSSGTALAIVQHTTRLPIKVNIKGGIFAGEIGLFESNIQGSTAEQLSLIEIEVTDGEFIATGDHAAVEVSDVRGFISGGIFSTGIDSSLLTTEVNLVKNADGSYVVMNYSKADISSANEVTFVDDDSDGKIVVTSNANYDGVTLNLVFEDQTVRIVADVKEGSNAFTFDYMSAEAHHAMILLASNAEIHTVSFSFVAPDVNSVAPQSVIVYYADDIEGSEAFYAGEGSVSGNVVSYKGAYHPGYRFDVSYEVPIKPPVWEDEDEYIPFPPQVIEPVQETEDDTVTVVACAAAAAVAALIAVFLIVDRRR